MQLLLLVVLFLLTGSTFAASTYFVQVQSGDRALQNIIVTATLPQNAADFPSSGILEGPGVAPIPFQRSDDQVVFILPALQKNASLRFTSRPAPSPAQPAAQADLSGNVLSLSVAGKKLLEYQGGKSVPPRPDIDKVYERGGYIHPVYSPSGNIITDDYPANHLHHHGIWFPWTKTKFEGREPDFWNMGEKKGTVEFVKFGQKWSGPVFAGFLAEHRFVDLTANERKTALNETWKVQAYNLPDSGYFLFDLVSTQKCTTGSPLILPKYHYGGLGLRGRWEWNGPTNAIFLTSAGQADRLKANESRGDWCYMGGRVAGQQSGIAVFSHPQNFRSPQPMRVHPSEPFFCFAPSQLGEWRIEPGTEYVSRYRFVVFDGTPDKAKLDGLMAGYAAAPTVTIERAGTK